MSTNRGKGVNTMGSENIISNGSKIFIPENTAAFIFSQSAIENIITTPGSYEYKDGEKSLLDGDGIKQAIVDQVKNRFGYGGISPEQKKIAFVNLREIRDIKFGTLEPQVYNDLFYGVDLDVYAHGSFTVKIVDPATFIRNFVPANVTYYSFSDQRVRGQIISEFLQSFIVTLNLLSKSYRISQLPSQVSEISSGIASDTLNAGTWKQRFGFEIVAVAIKNIELSPESKKIVRKFSDNKMSLKAYEEISQKASNIAAQQKIAQGIQENGLGDGGGMIYGINLANSLGTQGEAKASISFEKQVEVVKKLKDLLDAGILTQEEFDIKKKEIMEL